jgi:outer membrane protein assembly factor BamA
VPTRITVAEGKHQRVNFGIGYGTEERARVDGEYHHVNFFGGARTAGIHARWSRLDRGLRADFTQPYFFAPHFSLGAEAQQWYTYTPAYNSTNSRR